MTIRDDVLLVPSFYLGRPLPRKPTVSSWA